MIYGKEAEWFALVAYARACGARSWDEASGVVREVHARLGAMMPEAWAREIDAIMGREER